MDFFTFGTSLNKLIHPTVELHVNFFDKVGDCNFQTGPR